MYDTNASGLMFVDRALPEHSLFRINILGDLTVSAGQVHVVHMLCCAQVLGNLELRIEWRALQT